MVACHCEFHALLYDPGVKGLRLLQFNGRIRPRPRILLDSRMSFGVPEGLGPQKGLSRLQGFG